jgi:hypothetical protein
MGRRANQPEYHVYDGRSYLGRFTLDEGTGEAEAFDSQDGTLGKFSGFKAAAIAAGRALVAHGSRAKLRRLRR